MNIKITFKDIQIEVSEDTTGWSAKSIQELHELTFEDIMNIIKIEGNMNPYIVNNGIPVGDITKLNKL